MIGTTRPGHVSGIGTRTIGAGTRRPRESGCGNFRVLPSRILNFQARVRI